MGILDSILNVVFGEEPPRKRTREDASDPRKKRVHALLAPSHDVDPGHDPEFAVPAVRDWYGATDRERALRWIRDSEHSGDAYDLFRVVFVARCGFAAGYFSEAESWDICFRAVERAQRSYASWTEYGDGYLRAHLAYRRSQGDDDATLQRHDKNLRARFQKLASQGVWSQLPLQG